MEEEEEEEVVVGLLEAKAAAKETKTDCFSPITHTLSPPFLFSSSSSSSPLPRQLQLPQPRAATAAATTTTTPSTAGCPPRPNRHGRRLVAKLAAATEVSKTCGLHTGLKKTEAYHTVYQEGFKHNTNQSDHKSE